MTKENETNWREKDEVIAKVCTTGYELLGGDKILPGSAAILETAMPLMGEAVDNVSGRIGEKIEHLFQKNGDQTQTPSEKEAEVQNLADDEKRKQLEINLNVLQQKFDERHPDHDSPHTQELQKKLDEQFDAVRAQLEEKLADDRQIPLEQGKDRSR